MPDDTESLLKSLTPAPSLDRDEVMYRAGRASSRGWLWPLATLAATSAAVVLAVLLAMKPAVPEVSPLRGPTPPARPEETITPPARPEQTPQPEPVIAARRLEEQVLLHGLEGLGPVAPLPPAPTFPGDV